MSDIEMDFNRDFVKLHCLTEYLAKLFLFKMKDRFKLHIAGTFAAAYYV